MKKIRLLLFVLSLSSHSYSTIYIVPNGTERTTTLILPDFGDEAIVERFGIISVNSMPGISMNNNSQTTFNYGAIFTTGNNAEGIINNGNNNVINNYGLINTIGLNSAGMENTVGQNVEMTNYGVIILSGASAGMVNDAAANNTTMTNNGKIVATGSAIGMTNVGNNAIVTNNGFISTVGEIAIENTGNNVIITNNGTIRTIDSGANGIRTSGTNNIIINTGSILTEGIIDARGIFVRNTAANSLIINSGTIISQHSHAIEVDAVNPLLILLRGSNLQGSVDINADLLNLAVERGLNLALTLTPASPGFGVLSIDAPFVVVGKTIAVLDPTGLELQADVVADLSDTILNGIYRHRTAFVCPCTACGCEVWIEGIGSYRKRSHDKNVGYEDSQGGFIIGVNHPLCYGNVGLFGAISFGEGEVDQKTQKADITTYLGGISYEKICCDTFFGFAIALGYVDWCNERFVMNNLVAGGVQKATFDKGGVFVSPEVTIAHYFSFLGLSPIVSLTCRYAGCFFGDYHEHGSLTNLSVKDREIDLITTRLELSVPFTDKHCGCCWSVEPYIGGLGRFQVGGNHVAGFLFEQPITFDVGNPQNLAAFLLGCRGIQSFNRFNLFLNFEISFDNAKSTRLLGEGGIGIHF